MPEYEQAHWVLLYSSGGRGTESTDGRWGAVHHAAGHQATSHVANFSESSWRRNLGTARACGVMAGLEPCPGSPTPLFVCLGYCFASVLTTTPTQPREALLKYAKVGEEDLQWTAGVWSLRLFSQTRDNLMGTAVYLLVLT